MAVPPVMRFCISANTDKSRIHLRLLSCSAFVAAWILLSITWLRLAGVGDSRLFQVQPLQPCPAVQTNRTSFLESRTSGYQCYGPASEHSASLVNAWRLYKRALWSQGSVSAEATEAVILSIYEGLTQRQIAALRTNRAAYAERHDYRYNCLSSYGQHYCAILIGVS